jgi:hypothetical protein
MGAVKFEIFQVVIKLSLCNKILLGHNQRRFKDLLIFLPQFFRTLNFIESLKTFDL